MCLASVLPLSYRLFPHFEAIHSTVHILSFHHLLTFQNTLYHTTLYTPSSYTPLNTGNAYIVQHSSARHSTTGTATVATFTLYITWRGVTHIPTLG